MAPARAQPRALSLTVLAGPSPGEVFSKPGLARLKIGREEKRGNTFVVPHEEVSSKHAELVWDASAGTWFLVDLDSSNGTQLNSNRKCLAGQRYPLRDQDVIHLGPGTQLQVTIEPAAGDAAAAAAATVEQKLTADAERVAASIQAAAAAMVGQITDEWRERRRELEALLTGC